MRPLPLLDIGSTSAPASAPTWRDIRRRVIAEQEGRCPGCGLKPKRMDGEPAMDVITLPGGHHCGLCRKCRLLHDGPARAMKARRTRLFGAVQTSLLKPTKVRPRRPQEGPPTAAELRAEALAAVSPSASAAAGIEAVIGVMVRRGVVR